MNEVTFLSSTYQIDRKLYKYFSNIRFALDSITERRIHLDDPHGFNDPFDATFFLRNYSLMNTGDSVIEEWRKIIFYIAADPQLQTSPLRSEGAKCIAALTPEKISFHSNMPVIEMLNQVYDMVKDEVSFSLQDLCESVDRGFLTRDGMRRLACKISCFSEVFDSILMWSYYANGHQGVCIEYDLSKLDMTSEMNQRILKNISKVHYSPIRSDNLLSTDDNYLNFILSKSDVWSHEHEWRVVCETTAEYLPFDCVSGIYLGVTFDKKSEEMKKIFDAANTYPNLPIYQCKLNPDRFQIDTEILYSSFIHTYLHRHNK